jgi:hypothetical protein
MSLRVMKIPNLNCIVIRQDTNNEFFISTKDSIVFGIPTLSFILKFLVANNYINKKLLEGVLEECQE